MFAQENIPFATGHHSKGWDGLYKGELAPIGNYVCKVRYTTLDGRVIDQSSAFYLGR